MSSMDNLISEYFAQDNGNSNFEKEAQVELFAKLAATNGIDLEKLSEQQIAYLWNETFSKEAGDDESKKDEEEEEKEKEEHDKKAAADEEFLQKKESAAKLAEAEYIGRFMAHAMTDEIRKIAAKKEPSFLDKVRSGAHKAGDKAGKAVERVGKGVASVAGKASPKAGKFLGRHAKGTGAAALGAGAAAVAGGAAAAHHFSKKKESSALDELAAELAVEKAAAAGWNEEEAAGRIAGVINLDLVGDSEKVASAENLETAVDIRSVELLEAAGYPVTWGE
jgi:hypothetical protein